MHHPEHYTCHPEHYTCHPERSEGSPAAGYMTMLFSVTYSPNGQRGLAIMLKSVVSPRVKRK
jgi:hypothetical protein